MVEIKRDGTSDALKFLLICLVIIGHAIEPTRYSNVASGILYSVVYAFHMPLFVLLSGYFSKNQNLSKINKQAVSLVETYLVMAVIIGFVLGVGFRMVVSPSLSCWYLLSLICWRYMLYFLVEVLKFNENRVLISSLLIMVAFFCLPIRKYLGAFSIIRTSQFFFFFSVGYCIKDSFISRLRTERKLKMGLCLGSLLCMVFICVFSSRELHVFEFHRDTLFSLIDQFPFTPLIAAVYKFTLILVSLIISFAILTLKCLPGFFEKYGKHTLFFFFLQGILVHKFVLILPQNLIVELLFSFFVILLGVLLCNRIPWILTPVSSFIKFLKK